MTNDLTADKKKRCARARIVGGYFGLPAFGTSVYIAMRTGEHWVASALTNKSIQIFAIPSMFAAFSASSAIQFRAQLGAVAQTAGFIPAILLVAAGAWSWAAA